MPDNRTTKWILVTGDSASWPMIDDMIELQVGFHNDFAYCASRRGTCTVDSPLRGGGADFESYGRVGDGGIVVHTKYGENGHLQVKFNIKG